MTNLGRLTLEKKKIESEKACTWALSFNKQKWTCWISACIVRRSFQSHSCPSDRNVHQHSWTGASLHSCTTGHIPYTVTLSWRKQSRITCNGTVWELNVTSLPCWLSCYSFLPHKLSELLSWIRNLRKTRMHSIPQFFCSRLQYEKEIRNNEHRREFSQKKYMNRYFDHLAIILPSTYFSSEGLFCFCFYVYWATACCLKQKDQ